MTDPNLNILEQLEREWRDLCRGIREEKMEELFMQVAAATIQASAELTGEERAEALAFHDQTERDFLQSIEGLTEAQWTFRPALDRWSVQETAEHVVLVESMLGLGLAQTLARDPDPALTEQPHAWEAMKLRALDRFYRGFNAPPPAQPHGQWSIEETQRRFREGRAATRELLARPGLPLKDHAFNAGPGTFNCYHWLVLLSLHARRHLGQITEVKLTAASGGYPS
jgi:hypothetical protein